MAKYTYQDSTELPVQRDFIQDLQTFVDVTQKVIPLEKSAIETYNDTETRIKSLNKRINELERFEKNIKNYVEKLADDTDSEVRMRSKITIY
jgi:archaellum component FlaC